MFTKRGRSAWPRSRKKKRRSQRFNFSLHANLLQRDSVSTIVTNLRLESRPSNPRPNSRGETNGRVKKRKKKEGEREREGGQRGAKSFPWKRRGEIGGRARLEGIHADYLYNGWQRISVVLSGGDVGATRSSFPFHHRVANDSRSRRRQKRQLGGSQRKTSHGQFILNITARFAGYDLFWALKRASARPPLVHPRSAQCYPSLPTYNTSVIRI